MSLQDFYQSVNKNWLERHTIPSDDVSYSLFDEVEETIRKDLVALLQKERRRDTPFGHFIESFYTGRKQDLANLRVFIEQISGHRDIMSRIGLLNLYGIDSPIEVDFSYDQRDTKHYCIYISPPTLGIMKDDFKSGGDIAKKYKHYLHSLGREIGVSNLGDTIFELEKSLSVCYPDPEDEGNVDIKYNPMSYAQLAAQYPNLNFDALFDANQIPVDCRSGSIIVTRPQYMEHINKLMKTNSAEIWDTWVQFCIYSSFIQILPPPFRTMHFEFFIRTIRGQTKQHSQDHQAVLICDELAQDALGALYVKENFAEFTKIRDGAREIYKLVHSAAQKRIMKLKWLSEDSRRAAVYKLQKMNSKIAFPETWFNEFEGLTMDPKMFMLNVLALSKKSVLYEISKLRGESPQQRRMWNNSCYEVNAYYYAELNELCVPIGFIHDPFFSLKQSFVENLAGVGNVMAHEISHGFDEEGRKFDEFGNNFPWWTSIDIELYKTRTKALVDEFDKQKFYGLKINGELTLGENLADFGAIAICMDVLRTYWQHNGATPARRLADLREFFTAYARSWAFKNRRAARLQATKSDSHAPPELRVNVVVRHFAEFYEAFGFTSADEGWIPPEHRIDVWG
jgi:predicted metalloendopeptidase